MYFKCTVVILRNFGFFFRIQMEAMDAPISNFTAVHAGNPESDVAEVESFRLRVDDIFQKVDKVRRRRVCCLLHY